MYQQFVEDIFDKYLQRVKVARAAEKWFMQKL